MDFFKSAIASAISQGPLPGYTIAERVDFEQSIWSLNNGFKKVGIRGPIFVMSYEHGLTICSS